MAENDSPPAMSLQFDKAEYSGAEAAASVCSACKRPIDETYYTVNAAIVCEQCHQSLRTFSAGGSRFRRAFAATAWGLLAGLAGAALWYAVRRMTGYEIGLIAIVVGLMVGAAVRKGSRGRGGWFYQTLAVILTYSCIAAQYMPDILTVLIHGAREAQVAQVPAAAEPVEGKTSSKVSGEKAPAERAKPPAAATRKPEPAAVPAGDAGAPKPGIGEMILAIAVILVLTFALALAAPFLAGIENFIGLIIIAFALYEAWKINKRLPVQVAGPFRLAPAAASGTPGA